MKVRGIGFTYVQFCKLWFYPVKKQGYPAVLIFVLW
jgi:hypothetical protein